MASFIEKKYTPTKKAYKNVDFLNSATARNIRIMCEYEETYLRLKRNKVKATILFFGSARSKTREDYDSEFQRLRSAVDSAATDDEKADLESQLDRLTKIEWMIEYMDKVTELSRKLTEWAKSGAAQLKPDHLMTGAARYRKSSPHPKRLGQPVLSYSIIEEDTKAGEKIAEQEVMVCTGGGPGFMEAANKGAAQVEGAVNIGMGITLPFEDGLNEYVSEELAFEFHYFFTRKFWMVYHCQALVCCPGGLGTLDELFEVLTLKQTGKIQKDLPVVLFGKNYWQSIINWDVLAQSGTIAQRDIDELFFTDSVEQAFEYLTQNLQVPAEEA